jgi:DNA-binding transcriptional LysR family regulator
VTTNLPTDLLRSFTAIVDAGSMAKASERVFLTQSALSLQIKRLEELVQCPLFLREGSRKLVLSPVGHEMLSYARRILDLNDEAVTVLRSDNVTGRVRIGISQDFAELLITGTLRQFTKMHALAELEVCTASAGELVRRFEQADLDIVVTVSPPGNVHVVRRVETVWVGQPELVDEDVLPLALLTEPCQIRFMAIRTLETAGKPYRIVVQTPHLTDLQAAVSGGLGITCRTSLFAHGLTVLHSSRLPKLPPTSFSILTQNGDNLAVARLDKMVRQTVEQMEVWSEEPQS